MPTASGFSLVSFGNRLASPLFTVPSGTRCDRAASVPAASACGWRRVAAGWPVCPMCRPDPSSPHQLVFRLRRCPPRHQGGHCGHHRPEAPGPRPDVTSLQPTHDSRPHQERSVCRPQARASCVFPNPGKPAGVAVVLQLPSGRMSRFSAMGSSRRTTRRRTRRPVRPARPPVRRLRPAAAT